MSVLITDELLKNASITEEEFRIELAIFLFEKEIFTLGKASEFANLPQFIMQKELAKRKIPIHYGVNEYKEDMLTIKKMKDNL